MLPDRVGRAHEGQRHQHQDLREAEAIQATLDEALNK